MIEPYINRIHSAMDSDALIGLIAESLLQLRIGEQFAVLLVNSETGEFDTAAVHNMSDHQVTQCALRIQAKYPFDGVQLVNGGDENPVLCGNLVFQSKPYGVMTIPMHSEKSNSSIPDGVEYLLQAIGSALVKLKISEDFSRSNQVFRVKIEAINRIAELLRNRQLDQLLACLLESSLEIMNADAGAILLREKDGSLQSYVELGLREDIVLGLLNNQGGPFIEPIMKQAKPVLIQDLKSGGEVDLATLPDNLQSIICLPLATRTNQLGIIVIVNTDSSFEMDDFEVLSTIGFLASVAIENARLRIEQEKADRAQEQMNLARKIQQNMQAKCIPEVAEFEMDGWCIPCDETCGDYYDFIECRSGRLGVIVGDATGHGVAAALTMVAVRASLLSMLDLDFPLAEVFRHVNNRIERDGNSDRFMTLFCGLLDPQKKTMTYCSAGHDSPLLYRPRTDEIIAMEPTGIPIGMLADWDYELCEDFQLETGDILVIATDGVCEAFNMEDEVFGIERFKELLRSGRGKSAVEISTRIQKAVLDFINPAPRSDDITVSVLVVK